MLIGQTVIIRTANDATSALCACGKRNEGRGTRAEGTLIWVTGIQGSAEPSSRSPLPRVYDGRWQALASASESVGVGARQGGVEDGVLGLLYRGDREADRLLGVRLGLLGAARS